MAHKNYYKILEISPNATQEEIKNAYYRLVLEYHPDKSPENLSHFILIKEAFETLSHPSFKQQKEQQQKRNESQNQDILSTAQKKVADNLSQLADVPMYYLEGLYQVGKPLNLSFLSINSFVDKINQLNIKFNKEPEKLNAKERELIQKINLYKGESPFTMIKKTLLYYLKAPKREREKDFNDPFNPFCEGGNNWISFFNYSYDHLKGFVELSEEEKSYQPTTNETTYRDSPKKNLNNPKKQIGMISNRYDSLEESEIKFDKAHSVILVIGLLLCLSGIWRGTPFFFIGSLFFLLSGVQAISTIIRKMFLNFSQKENLRFKESLTEDFSIITTYLIFITLWFSFWFFLTFMIFS